MNELALPKGLNLLNTLMSAAGWHCNENRLFEAVPHMSDRLSPNDLIQTLTNLGVPALEERCRLKEISTEDCPGLFVDSQGNVCVVLDVDGNKVLTSSGDGREPTWQPLSRRQGRLIRLERFDNTNASQIVTSVSDVTQKFRGLIPWLLVAAFLSNVAGLATPLLIMVIYDRVIPTGSIDLVVSLIFAVLVLVATDAGFRAARASAMAHMGRYSEQHLGLALFRKLMALPVQQIEKSDVEQQLARFKQFEGFRDVFTGQMLTTLLDLPFTLIFFAVLFWLSPQVALLILVLAVIFLAIGWYFYPQQQKLSAAAAKNRTELQAHVFEAATHQRSIQRLGLEERWLEKQKFLTEQAARATRASSDSHLLSQNLGQSFMAIAGVSAVCIGTLAAMRGDLSFGALIAIMSLVWKILTPLQALYTNVPQIFGYQRSKRQSDRVLSIPEELVRGVRQSHQKIFSGLISISGVTHRYDASSLPAISQATLEIGAQEFAVVCGDETSGTTTLLNLMCGFYQPTIGTVQIDLDETALAVLALLACVAYRLERGDFVK